MSDRELILARIRGALADVPAQDPERWEPEGDADPAAAYLRCRELGADQLTALFAGRCGEYRARVTRCGAGAASIADAVAEICERQGVRTLAAPVDVDEAWCPAGVAVRRDDPPLELEELDGCGGVLTGCALAIALTGTIVLDGGAGQGRRALSLVPDLHICVVGSEEIVDGVPAAFDRLAGAVRAGRPVTLISGPSATSDIELRRVEGVHGPRRLEVILAAASD